MLLFRGLVQSAACVLLVQGTELLAAGFPCVDISQAGLRVGLNGPSSGLIRHVFRLLETAKAHGDIVPWVLLENVGADSS